jgi:xylan 1,4-beta-xylosidase
MGSPQSPSPAQYAELEQASELACLSASSSIGIEKGRATLAFTLPRQAVSLLLIEW